MPTSYRHPARRTTGGSRVPAAARLSFPARHRTDPMPTATPGQKDAYDLLLDAIDHGEFRPGDRLVESDLAERFGVSGAHPDARGAAAARGAGGARRRRPQPGGGGSLDHDQLGELYAARGRARGAGGAAGGAARGAGGGARALGAGAASVARSLARPARTATGAGDRSASTGQFDLASHNRYLRPAARHGASPDGAARHHLAGGRGARRPARSRSTRAIALRAIEARDGAAAEAAIRHHQPRLRDPPEARRRPQQRALTPAQIAWPKSPSRGSFRVFALPDF